MSDAASPDPLDAAAAIAALATATSLADELDPLARLVRLLPPDDVRWADALARLPDAPSWLHGQAVAVDHRDALAVLERVGACAAGAADPRAAAALATRTALVRAWGAGSWREAEADMARALEARHWGAERREAADAAIQLSWIVGGGGNLEGQLALAREVAAAERADGSPPTWRRAAAAAAWAAAWLGRAEEAGALLADARPVDGEREPSVIAADALVGALAGRPGAVRPLVSAVGRPDAGPGEIEAAAVVLAVADDTGALLALAADSESWQAGEADPRRRLAAALGAVAAAEADDAVAANRLLRSACADQAPSPPSPLGVTAAWARAAALRCEGGASAALPVLRRLLAAPGPVSRTALGHGLALDVSETAREASDHEVARIVRDRLDAEAAAAPGPFAHAAAQAARAVEALVGRAADRERLDEACRAALAFDELGAPGRAAAARATGGRIGAALGDRDLAAELLGAAASALAACGSRRRLTGVLCDLAALGQRGRRMAAELGGSALTARELEVARLAAAGLSAKAIAARLFISRRTVETHLAHIYAKLGIAGRRELESEAGRLGLG